MDLESKMEEHDCRKKSLTEAITKAKVGKEESDCRTEILTALTEKREEKTQLLAEIEKYKECDPEVVEGVRQQGFVSRDAANRWTDNIFSAKSWIRNKFSFEESVLDKQFGIPEDFDYVE